MNKWMKHGLLLVCMLTLLTGCSHTKNESALTNTDSSTETNFFENGTAIVLSDEEITVDGTAISKDSQNAVYAANDIVFYLEGQNFTYGAGTDADAHSQAEADAHTVVHITQPGSYVLSGSLSAGQIAVDLGEDAKEDPNAVVTLILNNTDISCSVAPAVIFYNVYECGSSDTETASKDVDTAAAGANVLIADGTTNHINGSYVAKIYKSVELNEAGTEITDSKKLHKYDGAFYSKMSMNIDGGEEGNGKLYIDADNEGLDSELHLTINGGEIYITSGNDGINTNEDGVSVTTINDGILNIQVSGTTGEGDGIDSNGWIVINGGMIYAQACSTSPDSGIDSDMGIHINGGTIIASGNMFDEIKESSQSYAVFSFTSQTDSSGSTPLELRSEDGAYRFLFEIENTFTFLVISTPDLKTGTYSLWQGETQLSVSSGGMMMNTRPDGNMPNGERPELPDNMTSPDNSEMPDKNMENSQPPELPDNMTPPDNSEMPGKNMENSERPELPDNMTPPQNNWQGMADASEASDTFTIEEGNNYFIVFFTEES